MFCPLSDVELCPASMQLLQRSGGVEGVDAGDSQALRIIGRCPHAWVWKDGSACPLCEVG